jgi:hypothetical protein
MLLLLLLLVVVVLLPMLAVGKVSTFTTNEAVCKFGNDNFRRN